MLQQHLFKKFFHLFQQILKFYHDISHITSSIHELKISFATRFYIFAAIFGFVAEKYTFTQVFKLSPHFCPDSSEMIVVILLMLFLLVVFSLVVVVVVVVVFDVVKKLDKPEFP